MLDHQLLKALDPQRQVAVALGYEHLRGSASSERVHRYRAFFVARSTEV